MNTPFGFRSELQGYVWRDLTEEIDKDGIKLKIANGIMEVCYNNEADGEKAKRIAELYVKCQILRQGQKIRVDFNHTWQTNSPGNKIHTMSLVDEVHSTDQTQIQTQTHQVTITGVASIVTQEMHDSASFLNDSTMVSKALKDLTLEQALCYFSDEVVNDNRPLYGIYKAIETIENHLKDSGKKLNQLACQNEKYVEDVMQTAQVQRHAITPGKRKLTDSECHQRAKILIEAYASTITI